jgi:hypothetical protein
MVAMAVGLLVGLLGPPAGRSARLLPVAEVRAEASPAAKAARRRWALQKMDEVAQERQRCRERFRTPAEVRACEAALDRRHRAYNELYLEAAR